MWVNGTERRDEMGFTLIELLITLVVVGILTAVAIMAVIGINGSASSSACQASMDAAKAATAVYFAKNSTYPQTFAAMTGATPGQYELPTNALVTATTLKKGAWTLTLTPNGPTNVTTYACS